METYQYVGASVFSLFVLLEIIFTNFFKKRGQTRTDVLFEIICTTYGALAQIAIVGASFALSATFIPEYAGVISSWPFLAIFGLFLIFDDLTQYWWHRLSHTHAWIYKLHRPHHNAAYLSIRVSARNNIFYYALLPGYWTSGVLIFLGGGWVYAFYVTIKMTVIYGAHSDVRWDEPLYKIKWLAPLMWIVERTISTPATHSAHHGKHAADGITHYKGNYGNLMFFWDVLFGTAKITRQYPTAMGVEDLPETSLGEQILWPLIRMPVEDALPEYNWYQSKNSHR